MWTVRKVVEFDSAHHLPDHPGKCKRLHGHRWKVVIEVAAAELDGEGMVCDFGELGRPVKELDHAYLNDVPPFDTTPPTAENLAKWVVDQVRPLVPNACRVMATVSETPGNDASFLWVRDFCEAGLP